MVNQTDTIENGSFNGNLTILNSGNADLGPGNLEVQGTVYTNTISANTTSGSITLTDPSLFTNSTASTSAITGALVVTGGIGITGNNYFAGVNTYTNTTVIPSANGTNTASGSINIAGGLALTGSANYSNAIIFNAVNNAEPNALGGTRSIGSKIVLWPNNGPAGTSSDYSIGIGASSMWYQVDTGSIFNWYSGATLIGAMNVNGMTIYGANALPSTSSTPSGALNVAGSLALYNTSALSACIMLQGGQYGPPNTTSRTIGTRIVLNPTAFPTSSTDYAIGITTSPGIGIWFGTNTLTDHFYFYNNTTITLDITNASTTFGSNNLVSITNGTLIPLNDISFTGVEGALNVAGDIVLSNATRQTIGFASGGVGAPSFTNRSTGSKIILLPAVTASTVDHAIGVTATSVWFSASASTHTIDKYIANVLVHRASNTSTSILQGTTSSSTATGALIVTGGTGISGNLFVGGTGNFAGISNFTNTNTIPLNDIVFTGVGGTINLAGDIVLFNATSQMIGFAAAGLGTPSFTNRTLGTKIILKPTVNATQTDSAIGVNTSSVWISNGISTGTIDFYIVNNLEMSLNNSTLSLLSNTTSSSTATGTLVVTGGTGISGDLFVGATTNSAGIGKFTSGTTSSSTATGAVVITGGIGISGNVFVGGTGNFAGILSVTNTTAATTVSTGALIVSGGIGAAKSIFCPTLILTKASTTGTLTPTVNSSAGFFTTTSLTTVSNGTQAITFTNSLIASTSVMQFTCQTSGTGVPYIVITSISSGSCVLALRNTGTAAFNNTITVYFFIC